MRHLPPHAVETFAGHYPEVPHIIDHHLCGHPLMELEALAQLAERLPAKNIEHAYAAQPIGVTGKPPVPDISAADAIRQIDTAGCWVALTFIEQDPTYAPCCWRWWRNCAPPSSRAPGRSTPRRPLFSCRLRMR
jgi:hypothetical protein